MKNEEYHRLLGKWANFLYVLPAVFCLLLVAYGVMYVLYQYPSILIVIFGLLFLIFAPPFIYSWVKNKIEVIKRNNE